MKKPNQAESPKVIGALAKIILSIILIGFAGLAIHNIRTLRVELDNSSSTVEELQTQTEQDAENIKNLEEEKKSLQDEKDNLEQKNKELEEKLQAKLEAQKKAQQATLASTKISGTCQEWMTQAGITDFENAYFIFQRESGCNPTATNKSSGAYGVCQSLPGNKMATAGTDWQTNPVTQMKWCQNYAQSRYGSWSKAVAFWKDNNWW